MARSSSLCCAACGLCGCVGLWVCGCMHVLPVQEAPLRPEPALSSAPTIASQPPLLRSPVPSSVKSRRRQPPSMWRPRKHQQRVWWQSKEAEGRPEGPAATSESPWQPEGLHMAQRDVKGAEAEAVPAARGRPAMGEVRAAAKQQPENKHHWRFFADMRELQESARVEELERALEYAAPRQHHRRKRRRRVSAGPFADDPPEDAVDPMFISGMWQAGPRPPHLHRHRHRLSITTATAATPPRHRRPAAVSAGALRVAVRRLTSHRRLPCDAAAGAPSPPFKTPPLQR